MSKRMLQHLATLVSINVLDLVVVEASTTATTDEFHSVEVGHTKFNHGQSHQDRCTTESCYAMDGDCGGNEGKTVLILGGGRRVGAGAARVVGGIGGTTAEDAIVDELEPVLDNGSRRLATLERWGDEVNNPFVCVLLCALVTFHICYDHHCCHQKAQSKLPRPFFFYIVVVVVQALLWLLLLVSIPSL